MNEYEITHLGVDGHTLITRNLLVDAGVPLWEVLRDFTEACGGSLETLQVSNLTATNRQKT